MNNIYNQIAKVTTYKLENIHTNKQDKLINFKYTSVMTSIEISGTLGNNYIKLVANLEKEYSQFNDTIKLLIILTNLTESINETEYKLEFTGDSVVLTGDANLSMDTYIKELDNYLYQIYHRLWLSMETIPEIGTDICMYPGIYLQQGVYKYVHKPHFIQLGHSVVHPSYRKYTGKILDTYNRHLVFRLKGGFQDFLNNVTILGSEDRVDITRYVVLNVNMLNMLRLVDDIQIDNNCILSKDSNEDDFNVYLTVNNRLNHYLLGKFIKGAFIFVDTQVPAFDFTILIDMGDMT